MKYTSTDLLSICNDLVVSNKIAADHHREYEWIDAVGIPQRPKQLSSCLYFATYSNGTDGWHKVFNRRPKVDNIIRDKGWHVVVDSTYPVVKGQHLIVSSIKDFSRRIYSDSRSKTAPFVIGVTGSVGKTTTVAFLEHLIRSAGFRVVRFWSHRLTPLSIETHYVNRVFSDTSFVVLEYSAFKSHHVARLVETLPPDLSFLINLSNQHIRSDLFKNKAEIYASKIQIKPHNSEGFVNSDVLRDLEVDTPTGWGSFSADTEFVDRNPFLPPTRRTGEMHAVGRIVAARVGISTEQFRNAFVSFVPKEDRLVTCSFEEGSLFFDSEAPHGPRLWSWFETVDGNVPTLLVDTINFGHDETSTYTDLLMKIFSSDETYVLDTEANRAHIPVHVAHFVNETEFRNILVKQLSRGNYTVYHMTVKGTIPNFVHGEYLETRWRLKRRN